MESKPEHQMSSIPSTRPTKAWVLYCTVWNLHTVDSDSKIEMVQRRSARYTCNRYHNTSSVSDMLITLNWSTLAESSCLYINLLPYGNHQTQSLYQLTQESG